MSRHLGLKDLSPGEKRLIERRRAGWTQEGLAYERGVSIKRYAQAERDCASEATTLAKEIIGTPGALGTLTEIESCLIKRRRGGWTQQDVADALNLSRYWVQMMETGQQPPERLIAYWQGR